MFAEEEWTDSPSADGSDQAVVNLVSSASAKDKVVGKRSLLRTLQTLGSVPDWEGEKPFEDSDEEKESSSVPNKTKKKRCKKRRRSSNVAKEEEQNPQDQVNSPETPVKKKRPMKKTNKETESSEMSQKSRNESAKGAPSGDGNQPEQNLSRKQWKNRMKNKRRCKNKYQEKTTADDNAKAKEEPLHQSKDVPATQTVQKNPKTSKKHKNIANVKNGISVHDDAENHKNSSMSSNHLQSKTQTADDCVGSSEVSQKVGDKGKPSKMMKKSQIQAEKLRRVLMLHHTDDNDGDKKKKDESNNNTVKLKCDAEETTPDRSSALRSKMEKRLEAARFRHINEQLYTSTSGEAKRMFQQDPDAIGIYHRGYTAQVQHWPENPVDSIISYIRQRPASLVVADFGCGDCKIARSVKNKVHSFDLAPVCELATACDMAKVPLQDSSVDMAVFCLSLMGTNLGDFLKEANRVLVMGGVLKIAEVASRFDDVRSFIGAMSSLGFKINNKDTENSHFYSFEFIKTRQAPENAKKPGLELKPCLYKKR